MYLVIIISRPWLGIPYFHHFSSYYVLHDLVELKEVMKIDRFFFAMISITSFTTKKNAAIFDQFSIILFSFYKKTLATTNLQSTHANPW